MQPTPVFLPEKFHGQKPGELQSMGSQRVGRDGVCTKILETILRLKLQDFI